MIKLDENLVEFARLGGALLCGGDGGSLEDGKIIGEMAV